MVKTINNYVIDSDSRQFILKKRSGTDKDGNPTYQSLKYYQDIESCLYALWLILAREKVSSDTLTLQEAYNQFKELANEVKKISVGISLAEFNQGKVFDQEE